MTVWQALLLGVVQGLTEFLPVSSSGHLAIAQQLLPGFSQPGVAFDVALHLGTVGAVLALEWRRLEEALHGGYLLRLGAQLAVATVATAVVAFPLRAHAELAFQRPLAVAVGLIATGLLLLVGRGVAGRRGAGDAPWATVLFVGLAQGAAVMPGLSRSGSTIVAGAVGGLERRWAADFSFLLSVPAVLGAAVVEAWSYRSQVASLGVGFLVPAILGAAMAAVVGGATLLLVRRLVLAGRLHLFAYYVLPLGLLVAAAATAGLLR